MVAASNRASKDGDEKSRGLKKGPWTTGEDAILMEYVRKHGEGNWNAVQRNCGLLRCGKSCRLRWANHLRPNLKKGSFTLDEERLIIELHAKIGNKWARMASQLPGRTDNEIKNYWNTRVKRLQRAGLPIYPEDIPHNYQNHHLNQQTNTNYPMSPSFSSKFNTSISFLTPTFDFPTMVNPPFLFNSNPRIAGNLCMPLTNSLSPFASPSLSLYGQSLRMSGPYSPFGLFNGPRKLELSSIQTHSTCVNPIMPALSATSGSGGGGHNVVRAQEEEFFFKKDGFEEGNYNSGLLEDLLEESNTLAKAKKIKKENSFVDGKQEEFNEEEDSNADPYSSPLYSSCGLKEEPIEEMNQVDDDLSSLLNNFPSSSPIPDWYDTTANATVNTRKEQNSGLVMERTTSANPKWSMGSCCWNNMPTIC